MFPSEVLKLFPTLLVRWFLSVQKHHLLHDALPGAQVLAPKSFAYFFIHIFCPILFWGDWLTFSDVGFLLSVFSMYSLVGVSYARNFLYICWKGGDLTILVFHSLENPLFSDLMIYSLLQTVLCVCVCVCVLFWSSVSSCFRCKVSCVFDVFLVSWGTIIFLQTSLAMSHSFGVIVFLLSFVYWYFYFHFDFLSYLLII